MVKSRSETLIFTRDIGVAFAGLVFGGRAIFESHDIPRGRVAALLLKRSSRFARFRMVTNCSALARFYSREYGLPPHRVRPLHNGCFLEDYDALRSAEKSVVRAELQLPSDRFIVVHTGSLYKGGAELFGHAAGSAAIDVEFIHVGASREECGYWTGYYEQRGVSNIRFIPHRSAADVRKYQRAADMLFFVSTKNSPIWWCTSPLKLFEYMASGTPVLASCIGSVQEVLNERNAYCFDPDRPETIGQAMSRFLDDDARGSERSMAALADARDRYSWSGRAERIIAFAAEKIPSE